MAISVASLGTSTATTDTPTLALSGISAGDVLVIAITTRFTSQAMVTPPSGWDAGPSGVSGSQFNCFTFYRIADGTENSTNVSAVLANSNACQITGVRATGFVGTATLEGTPGEDETYLSTVTTTGGFGSVTPTSADSVIIAVLATDSHLSPEATVSGFAHTVNNSVNNGNAEIFTRILTSASTQSPTWSSSDSDEAYGAIFAFGDVVSAGIPEGAGTVLAVGSLVGAGATVKSGAGAVSAVGSIVGTGEAPAVAAEGAGTVVAIGSLVGAGATVTSGAGAVSGVGSIVGTGDAPAASTAEGAGTVVAIGSLVGTGATAKSGAGSVSAIGSLVGEGDAPGVAGVPVSVVVSLTTRSVSVTMSKRTASVSFSKRSAECALEVA